MVLDISQTLQTNAQKEIRVQLSHFYLDDDIINPIQEAILEPNFDS